MTKEGVSKYKIRIQTMKQIIISFLVLLSSANGWAQNYVVKQQKAIVDDYIALMNFARYEAFSFDVSSLIDSTRVFEIIFREFERDSMVTEQSFFSTENRKMLSVFDETDQKKIHDEGSAFDEAKGIYKVAQKLIVGFLPIENDSTERVFLNIENMARGAYCLHLKPAVNTKTVETLLEYNCVPYKITEFEFNKFIPLVMYGSFWYDEEYDFFRFCGEQEIDPNEGASMQKYMPHYYIVGMVVR